MLSPIILGESLSSTLLSIQRNARIVDETTLRLASGLKVNSALDNPQNFFNAQSLKNRAQDLNRLLDGISQSVRTIEEANNGVDALSDILELAETSATNAQEQLTRGNESLSEIILEDEPVAYWRLNETSGNVATNLGTGGTAINGTYQGGVSQGEDPLYVGGGDTASRFDGVNDFIRIPDSLLINTDPAGYPAKSVELVFRADNTAGRQVLYEEGGTTNAFAIYIDNGRVYFNARDAGDFGPFDISFPIEAGETYHVAAVLDDPNSVFTGFVNAQAVGTGVVTKPLNRHTADTAIGRTSGGTFFHDGGNGGNGEYFSGTISDVAVYNSVLSQEDLQERYDTTLLELSAQLEDELEAITEQITPLIEDANYRGINLLSGETLRTFFNEDRSNFLDIIGQNFSAKNFDLTTFNFNNTIGIQRAIDAVRNAIQEVRGFGRSLANDLSIISTRETFTLETINTLKAGSDDLTIADQNEEGANLLALGVRQQVALSVLSFGANQVSIGELIA